MKPKIKSVFGIEPIILNVLDVASDVLEHLSDEAAKKLEKWTEKKPKDSRKKRLAEKEKERKEQFKEIGLEQDSYLEFIQSVENQNHDVDDRLSELKEAQVDKELER